MIVWNFIGSMKAKKKKKNAWSIKTNKQKNPWLQVMYNE